jgi:hypothetical protein
VTWEDGKWEQEPVSTDTGSAGPSPSEEDRIVGRMGADRRRREGERLLQEQRRRDPGRIELSDHHMFGSGN